MKKLLQIVGRGRTSLFFMRFSVLRVIFVLALGVLGIAACKAANSPKSDPAHPLAKDGTPAPVGTLFAEEKEPTGKLVAFKDESDLRAFGAGWREQQEGFNVPGFYKMAGGADAGAAGPLPQPKTPKPADNKPSAGAPGHAAPAPPPPPAAAPRPAPAATAAAPAQRSASKPAEAKADKSSSKDRDGARFSDDSVKKEGGESESITNNQHAAVDEGDIVKLHGDHLIVLRRGRLFTLTLEGEKIRQSAMLDAFGPDIDPRGSWYDEIVVEGDHVVVVGFSYNRGGTEIGLFRIDSLGQLTYRATYHLKSNDYYSARNYASRIVDGRLIFYAPLYINPHETDLASHFPSVRRWTRNAKESDFVRTLVPSRLYHLDGEYPASPTAALHTVTSCDLREPAFNCESIGVIGPPGRVFYVSPTNVYVWMQDFLRTRPGQPSSQEGSSRDGEKKRPNGMVARLPIGRIKNAAPSAVRVAGMPTDQFSFEEDETGHLNVLVRSESNGDAMFASEATTGATALLRMPSLLFASQDVPAASSRRYRIMPRPDGSSVQNRFIGSWLLYGSGQGYVTEHHGKGQLYGVRYAASQEDPPTTMELDQGIDRIEAMGDDAVVVGSRGPDLVFTPIELGNSKEAHARRDFVRKNAAQGELRSHGFFFKPSKGNPRDGVVGLPIVSDGEEGPRGAAHLLEGSAAVLFLSMHSLEFSELGSLRASRLTTNHDGCRASCVDWYGNARPIFAKNRIFALMGYELVEGRIDDQDRNARTSRITEKTRLSFAPRGGPPATDDF